MPASSSSPAGAALRTGVAVIIFACLGVFIARNVEELRGHQFQIDWTCAALSLCLTVCYVFAYSLIWHYLTVKSHCAVPLREAITVRVYSEFGKYVPGRALGLAMILYLYDKRGQPKKTVSFCLYFEYVATLLGAVVAFLLSLPFLDSSFLKELKWLSAAWAGLLVALLHPKILALALNAAARLFRREEVAVDISYVQILVVVLMNVMNWLLLGVAMFLFINAVVPLSPAFLLFVMSAFAVASFLGLVALFTPAGLGVRESMLAVVLSLVLPKALGSLLAVASRVWLLAAEGLLFAIVFLFNRLNGGRCSRPELE